MGMTWIAACSGQRGIYQETIMTDEERQKLCDELRNRSDDWLPERLRTDVRGIAADEIERLAEENRQLKRSLDYAWRRIKAETGAVE
jgi:hypothetical protein